MSERLLVLTQGPVTTESSHGRERTVTTMGGPEKGREYALVRDDSDYYAVEVDDHRVGVVLSELSSFVFNLDGALHFLVAGVSDADHVEVALREPQTCRVKNGVWMAFPGRSRPVRGSPPPTRTGTAASWPGARSSRSSEERFRGRLPAALRSPRRSSLAIASRETEQRRPITPAG